MGKELKQEFDRIANLYNLKVRELGIFTEYTLTPETRILFNQAMEKDDEMVFEGAKWAVKKLVGK